MRWGLSKNNNNNIESNLKKDKNLGFKNNMAYLVQC